MADDLPSIMSLVFLHTSELDSRSVVEAIGEKAPADIHSESFTFLHVRALFVGRC